MQGSPGNEESATLRDSVRPNSSAHMPGLWVQKPGVVQLLAA